MCVLCAERIFRLSDFGCEFAERSWRLPTSANQKAAEETRKRSERPFLSSDAAAKRNWALLVELVRMTLGLTG